MGMESATSASAGITNGRVDVNDLVATNLAIFNPALATDLCEIESKVSPDRGLSIIP